METLSGFLGLLIIVAFIVGMIKPSWIKLPTRGKVALYSFGAFVALGILMSFVSPKSPAAKTADQSAAKAPVVAEQKKAVPEPIKTPEQLFEENIKAEVKNIGASKFTYKGIELKNADANRPKDSKTVTVSVNVGDFWNKDALVRNTSELTSTIFQKSIESKLPLTDYIVWYYGQTKDQYGNSGESIIMSYASTKETVSKINWNGFDKNSMCDLLKNQPSENFDNVCVLKVNIE